MSSLRLLATALCASGLVAASGCGSITGEPDPIDPQPGTEPAAEQGQARVEGRTEEAIALLRSGAYEEARGVLDSILLDGYLSRARDLLSTNAPEDGLLAIDRALELAPNDDEARFLKGEASLQLAEKSMAAGHSALLVEGALQDALASYRRTRRVEASFGAGKSAWLLGDVAGALAYVRAGREALGAEATDQELRTFVDVAFTAYTEAKSDEARAKEAQKLFQEVEGALSELLGRSDEESWVFGKLSDLYEWEKKYGDARSILEQGLRVSSADPALLERLARVMRSAGGGRGAIEALAAYNAEHPGEPVGLWYEARERFDLGTTTLRDEPPPLALFQQAEALFRTSRELEASYSDSCLGYEVVARAGQGWCQYFAGELEAARATFRSMDEVKPDGLEWKVEGRLGSGISGLEFVGAAFNEAGDWEQAAKTFEVLRAAQPEVGRWANNAGFFFRDAAVDRENEGYRLCRAATGALDDPEALAALRARAGVAEDQVGTPAEAERLATAAEATRERAIALMARSRAAYLDAARLAPDDVRVVNDAALVLVYYTHTDLELAESLLLRCVEMGKEQLADEELDADARWELENAWGDAHQNLGILHANLKDDFAGAAEWFRRAVEIGPDPRPVLTGFWIPYVTGERELQPGDDRTVLKRWASPCVD